MTARRISVIVPTCDRTTPLRRALASIRALEGDDIALEIIVADNAGCAETRAIADEAGARYVAVEKRGVSETRNAAMRLATGEFMAFLDDDDAWLPGHLRAHIALFDQNPTLDLVLGQVQSADDRYTPFGDPWPTKLPEERKALLRKMLSGFFPQVGSILVRTRVRDTVGYFDTGLPGGEDLDWQLRIAAHSGAGFVRAPSVLFTHREIGTFDKLQLQRIKYDRIVFNRYAWRWWHIWQSPMQLSRAYSGTVMHYYRYFVDAALERAQRGEKAGAWSAIWTAIGIFPFRAIKHLMSDTPLRQALGRTLASSTAAAHISHLPLWVIALNY